MPELLELAGCTPEPLMNYLKALGILRLVSEQVADSKARGAWRNGVFQLSSSLNRIGLVEFFECIYQPTPIVVPWTGSDFFRVDPTARGRTYKKTPTGAAIVEAFISTEEDRLYAYRKAVLASLDSLVAVGITEQAQMKGSAKSAYLSHLRANSPERTVDWIDAAAVMQDEKATFSALLGSGGGSDGNTHFSDNFMQNLWEMLPSFDSQRQFGRGETIEGTRAACRSLLEHALWRTTSCDLVKGRTSSLFDAGAVGGPNAGQGFERAAFANPWNFILALEGAVCFAGAISKRAAAETQFASTFPFQFQLSVTNEDSATNNEESGREVWLPLWEKFATSGELVTLLTEGRSDVSRSQARRGVDMARAAAGLGIDRGIAAFNRFAIVKGRVGGDNYNTASHLCRFDVHTTTEVDLLRQIDPWLDRFRSACREDTTPARFTTALRRIDATIFDLCRYGRVHFQRLLVALGNAERELASGEKFRKTDRRTVPPLGGLSVEWLDAAYDNSPEFEIAVALAGLVDREKRIGAFRVNLEPVDLSRAFPQWAEKDRRVVWNKANVTTNLAAVLSRRLVDANRIGDKHGALRSRVFVSQGAINAFLCGDVDDDRLSDLIWGAILVETPEETPETNFNAVEGSMRTPTYDLLKLVFLADSLAIDKEAIFVPLEPAIISLLLRGDVVAACQIATRRLRSVGLMPIPHSRSGRFTRESDWNDAKIAVDASRLAAALLLPISPGTATSVRKRVTRQEQLNDSDPSNLQETAQ